MKRILGLDLGTNSIGWALVEEAENDNEKSKIIKLGVRVNPLTVDEKTNFEKGKPLSTNADRTLKRGARRNLQRYKLRREHLCKLLSKNSIIDNDFVLAERGKNSTHQTLRIRAKAAREKIALNDLAKVFFTINKKRGYKSSRKTKNEEDGVAIDGMAVAKYLYDNQLTPGAYALQLLEQNKKYIPDFYRSDLQNEFDTVWKVQKQFYPEILSDQLYNELQGRNKGQTWTIFQKPTGIVGIKLEGKPAEQKLLRYQLRAKGLSEKLELEHLAIVLQEINNDKNRSSGYLGNISDRSKTLYINKRTVGEYLWEQVAKDPHTSLKNQVFYRQDYLDEFEKIWETQAKHHIVLTPSLKEEIRDTIIFYQRRLKSQKGLLDFCQFECWEEIRKDKEGRPLLNESTGLPKKRTVGHRVIPKSSPLFQEFKIWQNLNNLTFKNESTKEILEIAKLDDDVRTDLFQELNLRGTLKPGAILKILAHHVEIGKASKWKCNFTEIQGNQTHKMLYNIFQTILEREGYGFDWAKKTAREITTELKVVFPSIGIDPNILDFDANLEGSGFDKQASYQLWHLLYSAEDDHVVYEEDRLIYGNTDVNLKKKLHQKFGFGPEYAGMLANASFQDDYGNLSARAIRKILPFMQGGHEYSEACNLAGYNHSHSLTRKELEQRELKDRLELLPKNSLRNPVVEKILNQMVNLVNQICDTYGKPQEIRIELARELKKSAKERDEASRGIAAATRKNDEIKALILKEFGFTATRNDVIRYRLWQELEKNGHKTLFSDEYIPLGKVFSKDIDIEHIIPKALLFDDSFSNKTLAYKKINLQKRDRTALDFIEQDFNADLDNYKARVESLYKEGGIARGKYKKLLMPATNLSDGFIERDLRNSQYIAKKAKEMLQQIVHEPIVSTSGRITDKLREDWDLINVMKELNLPKYRTLGLTTMETRWDSGQEKERKIEVIKDWTKRNDHRHHAMDALTVAFTSYNHIQYINYLNARRDENHKMHNNIKGIEHSIKKDGKYVPPMQHFRAEAKKHIESILISFKTKNKVVTKNINATKTKNGKNTKIQLTPRGQLHKETVYGKSKRPMAKPSKINKKFGLEQARSIIDKTQRDLVLHHLSKYSNDPEVAFDTKTLKKEPIYYKDEPLKEVLCFEEIFTISKAISPDLKIDKVVDDKVREVLQTRLNEFGGKPKEAFSNLLKDPIWLNKAKGIQIKRVTITGVSNAEPLHHKKNLLGHTILDKDQNTIPVDYVSTGNNHHVAIYKDGNGKLRERVVSFYEAVARINDRLPVVDKTYSAALGWEFLFTLKQNEMFVFPNEADGFDPFEIDLMDENNARKISKYLFRVQKIATKNYVFRHHLETTVTNDLDFTYRSIRSTGGLDGIVKVRTNHLGKIVQLGEY